MIFDRDNHRRGGRSDLAIREDDLGSAGDQDHVVDQLSFEIDFYLVRHSVDGEFTGGWCDNRFTFGSVLAQLYRLRQGESGIWIRLRAQRSLNRALGKRDVLAFALNQGSLEMGTPPVKP